MGRAPCCDKASVKKGPWSPEEDVKLRSYIQQHGTGGNWIALPQKMGLKRCGKSCRLRWLNYLRPDIKHGGFSDEEDSIICSLYVSIGSRWSIIAAQLPGRTDNDIKNYWNTKLKKKWLGNPKKKEQHLGIHEASSSKSAKQVDMKSVDGLIVVEPIITNNQTVYPQVMVEARAQADDLISSSSTSSIMDWSVNMDYSSLLSGTEVEATNIFSAELDRLLYGDEIMKLDSLDEVYGDIINVGSDRSGTSSLSFVDDGIINPLDCPLPVSSSSYNIINGVQQQPQPQQHEQSDPCLNQ